MMERGNEVELSKIPTYQAGIMQSKAYRSLRVFMAGLLKKYELTMMQWAIIGLVYESDKKGIKVSDIAERLDTTVAFVTTHINLLSTLDFVERTVGLKDSRVRVISINPKAKKRIQKIENDLRSQMRRKLYRLITPEELSAYIKVLNKLALIDKS